MPSEMGHSDGEMQSHLQHVGREKPRASEPACLAVMSSLVVGEVGVVAASGEGRGRAPRRGVRSGSDLSEGCAHKLTWRQV